jgi:hypothetical protein
MIKTNTFLILCLMVILIVFLIYQKQNRIQLEYFSNQKEFFVNEEDETVIEEEAEEVDYVFSEEEDQVNNLNVDKDESNSSLTGSSINNIGMPLVTENGTSKPNKLDEKSSTKQKKQNSIIMNFEPILNKTVNNNDYRNSIFS